MARWGGCRSSTPQSRGSKPPGPSGSRLGSGKRAFVALPTGGCRSGGRRLVRQPALNGAGEWFVARGSGSHERAGWELLSRALLIRAGFLQKFGVNVKFYISDKNKKIRNFEKSKILPTRGLELGFLTRQSSDYVVSNIICSSILFYF